MGMGILEAANNGAIDDRDDYDNHPQSLTFTCCSTSNMKNPPKTNHSSSAIASIDRGHESEQFNIMTSGYKNFFETIDAGRSGLSKYSSDGVAFPPSLSRSLSLLSGHHTRKEPTPNPDPKTIEFSILTSSAYRNGHRVLDDKYINSGRSGVDNSSNSYYGVAFHPSLSLSLSLLGGQKKRKERTQKPDAETTVISILSSGHLQLVDDKYYTKELDLELKLACSTTSDSRKRFKTGSSNLVDHCRQNRAVSLGSGWNIKKKITASDIGGQTRLLINTKLVKEYICPQLRENSLVDQVESEQGLRVIVADKDTNANHEVTFKRWKSSMSYVFIDGWSKNFVQSRGLEVGETIGLRCCGRCSNDDGGATLRFEFSVLSRADGYY